MSSRGWEGVTAAQVAAKQSLKGRAKPSKYRSMRCTVEGQKFDSQREAQHWLELKARLAAGEISRLERQVPFDLVCPQPSGGTVTVARFIADMVYFDRQGQRHVVDSKGVRTALYRLKAKWLFCQENIIVEEM